jgi:hypothetical protein
MPLQGNDPPLGPETVLVSIQFQRVFHNGSRNKHNEIHGVQTLEFD